MGIMTSRKYSDEEIMSDLTENKRKPFGCMIVFDPDDVRYEDSATVTISMPRGAWKIVYAMTESSKISLTAMLADLILQGINRSIDNIQEVTPDGKIHGD